ncbi:L-serine ammonia-lyase [Coraliomargarita sinensis]|uniref:L-serine dehydratase n=1 Tax=Coraliomargarita sinensis TaxID=2174842 RepID=A0A317ZIW1_9BACT|nr:L-serine ammonia-lyase [Coraliomargarita sinensis]PXA04163.1 L-serine ammonia-lyase [Coraliomargarita sinensis]
MFISALEIFKLGIGPSSSHTTGPMVAAGAFRECMDEYLSGAEDKASDALRVQCILKGSLAFTGKGHSTDSALTFGLHGYTAEELSTQDSAEVLKALLEKPGIVLGKSGATVAFDREKDVVFDRGPALEEHSNGMIFQLSKGEDVLLEKRYFSIGGGFVCTEEEIKELAGPVKMHSEKKERHYYDCAEELLEIADTTGLSIAEIQRENELCYRSEKELNEGLDKIWETMCHSLERGFSSEGRLPGSLKVERRSKKIYESLKQADRNITINEWLSVYAIAVNEENAAGHSIVTAPTNGAAGVIPAVFYAYMQHEGGKPAEVYDYLLTATAIGGIIKHNGSISGAEVGCQGEVGSAASMAAAGFCAVRGGTARQIENAAEIALEHHLGMTCDPIGGLVQIPCIERNAFGAVKAHAAANLALSGSGTHFVSLDSCIAAMQQTGKEMSSKYKETSLAGLAVTVTEC